MANEVNAARRRIVEQPDAWHPLGKGLRRILLKRFTYAIIYRPSAEEVVSVAYAHLRRRPGYWRGRR